MEEDIAQSTVNKYRNTLFSFATKNDDSVIDLKDPEIMKFTNGFCLDMASHQSQLELLVLLYHSSDLEAGAYADKATFEGGKSRYFGDNVLCYGCGQAGHQERKCPRNTSSFCILCAEEGHYKYNCPQKVCLKCYKCGHCARDCLEKGESKRYAVCRKCTGAEHSVMECPRAWRIYTVCGPPKKLTSKACPLCLSQNHFVDDCDPRKARSSIFSSNFYKVAQQSRKEKST